MSCRWSWVDKKHRHYNPLEKRLTIEQSFFNAPIIVSASRCTFSQLRQHSSTHIIYSLFLYVMCRLSSTSMSFILTCMHECVDLVENMHMDWNKRLVDNNHTCIYVSLDFDRQRITSMWNHSLFLISTWVSFVVPNESVTYAQLFVTCGVVSVSLKLIHGNSEKSPNRLESVTICITKSKIQHEKFNKIVAQINITIHNVRYAKCDILAVSLVSISWWLD